MNKLNWIFAILTAAAIIGGSFSTAQAMPTDSLHYRLGSDTAVWDEELAAYTIDIDFEMKYDVPDKLLRSMVAAIQFRSDLFSFLSFSADSANWKAWSGVVNQSKVNDSLERVAFELILFEPVPDTSRTTGEFVRYATVTFKIADQSSHIEGGIFFVKSTSNDIIIFGELEWDMGDNYTDGTPIFLGITETPCCNTPGDANNNGRVNISDITFVISRIFAGGPPAPCLAEADADANATLNIADVTFMIARIFAGGPAPSCVSTIP